MKLQCLIIDDEPLARKRLSTLVDQIPELQLKSMCKTGQEAIAMIEQFQPDLIFLDIQMKDMSGFDVLEKIDPQQRPLVIFVTAFDKYAIKAFDYFAFDYLLKPFKKERFLTSVDRIFKHLNENKESAVQERLDQLLAHINTQQPLPQNSEVPKKVPIRIGNSISFIDPLTIKYITASRSYVDIHTELKIYTQRCSLTKLSEDINQPALQRIHRSTIININFIKKVVHAGHNELEILMTDDKVFRVSKSYKKSLQSTLGI